MKTAISDHNQPIIARSLTKILGYALQLQASAIHLQSTANKLEVRYRLDNGLQTVLVLSAAYGPGLFKKISNLAGLTPEIHEGQFKIHRPSYNAVLRALWVPTAEGPKIVLEIERQNKVQPELTELLPTALEKTVLTALRPSGLLVITGPTNSGKMTLAQAILRRLAKPNLNIVSLSEMAQAPIAGVNQSIIDPRRGYDWPQALHSLGRQDADLIFLSRCDRPEILRQALLSSTNKLIITILPSPSATDALRLLTSLAPEAKLLLAQLKLLIYQQLEPRQCPRCRQAVELTAVERLAMEKKLNFDQVLKKIVRDGLIGEVEHNFYKTTGCANCQHSGYNGKISLQQILLGGPALADWHLLSSSEQNKVIKKQTAHGLLESALAQTLLGNLSLEQLLKLA